MCLVCDYPHSTVSCPYCSSSYCVPCTRTYLIETVYDAHCMSCRKPWTRQFLVDHLPASFIKKEYRKKKEMLLFEKERSYFPETRVVCAYKSNIKIIDNKIDALQLQIHALQKDITALKEEKSVIIRTMMKPCKDKPIFCSTSGCNGVVLDRICSMCHVTKCQTCNQPVTTDHTCDPSEIESFRFINETSKACPNCSIRIERSSGCDHMWCTSCHTPFRWSTLKIEPRVLPNPHYYEYLAKTATTLCDNEVVLNHTHVPLLEQKIVALQVDQTRINALITRLRMVINLRETILPEIPMENEYTHQELRIRYIQEDITEERFKSLLFLHDKTNQSNYEYRELLTTYITILSEWYRSMDNTIALTFESNEDSLRTYINHHISELNKRNGSTFRLLV